ncbi:MAG: hypothetical protein SWY16_00900 [Cyanobacteriota bacterium]|nr:hypothetical protein [Cyanobacteriota bacterium]
MTQPHLLELAKQGEPRAISALLNQHLKDRGIRSKVALKEGCLHVLLESAEQVPDRYQMVDFVRVKLVNLESESITRAIVYGRLQGQEKPAWNQEFALAVGGYSNLVSSQSHSFPLTLAQDATDTGNSLESELPPAASQARELNQDKPKPKSRISPVAIAFIILAGLVAIASVYWVVSSNAPDPAPTPQGNTEMMDDK